MKIKTRFAPSPTGFLHIGSIRTALYSWLFARKLGGQFILRIEDSNLERSTQSSIKTIIDSMKWLNLNWDEGPYFQSERIERYNAVVKDMLSHGTAYKCYCSKKRLKELREKQIIQGEKPRYDGYCRNNNYQSINEPYVVRFSNPQTGSVIFNDLIRGSIEFNNQELDDLIICRTNGSFTYNFCVVVDDYDMAITHVIRGEEHINNTPRQINIMKALGMPIPNYAHVSIILDNDGKKLSKRYGAVGLMQYRDNGFLPEALLNYIVRLGWSHRDKEIFNLEEMKQLFNFDAVSKSASKFNIKRLLWLNHYYMNHLSANYVAKHLAWHINQQKININNGPELSQVVKLFSKRCRTLKELAASCRYFYEDFDKFNTIIANKYLHPETFSLLQVIRDKFIALDKWTPDLINTIIKKSAEEFQVEVCKISMILRVAITGTIQSPALDATIHTIGKSRSVTRINLALDFISRQYDIINS